METNGVENQVFALPLSEARDLLEIAYLVNAILRSGGNLSLAAQELGIGRRTMYTMIDRHGISSSDGRLSIKLTSLLSHVQVQVPHLERYIE